MGIALLNHFQNVSGGYDTYDLIRATRKNFLPNSNETYVNAASSDLNYSTVWGNAATEDDFMEFNDYMAIIGVLEYDIHFSLGERGDYASGYTQYDPGFICKTAWNASTAISPSVSQSFYFVNGIKVEETLTNKRYKNKRVERAIRISRKNDTFTNPDSTSHSLKFNEHLFKITFTLYRGYTKKGSGSSTIYFHRAAWPLIDDGYMEFRIYGTDKLDSDTISKL